ncbi:hypothetical protein [Glycomyces harbinensis]|uniref:Uncharacterized protein n=1 Tax=Glycomyces harbinensis TaxID=58114 RepID=A0A1G6U5S3_9ACTN|nr:hypothetical protein [Glycomyces harbinensis]SDD36669.1 hypothetical protein SAMN05216270_103334 [Glycomyces harbinensis]
MTDPSAAPPQFRRAEPDADRSNTATWHLCARVYMDPAFRDHVLNDYYEREDRALAPDPGIDRGLVVRHALHARTVNAGAMLAIFGLGLVLMASQPWADRLVLAAVCLCWLAAACVVQQAAANWRLRMETYSVGALFYGLPIRFVVGAGAALLAIGWLVGWDRRPWHLAAQLGGLALISALAGLYRGYRVARIPNGRNPPGVPNPWLARIERTRGAEVVTHRPELAIVGFGIRGAVAQVVLPLRTPNRAPAPELVDLELIVKEVRAHIESLATEACAESDLPRLELFEHVFVADSEVRRPVYWVKDLHVGGRTFESIADIRSAPLPMVQPFLRIQVSQSGGELVTNLFVRFVLEVDTLTIDFAPYHLLPTQARFRLFRDGEAEAAPLLVCSAGFGFMAVPLIVLQAPVSAAKTLWRWTARGTRPFIRWIDWTPGECGAGNGIREASVDESVSHSAAAEATERMAALLVRQCKAGLRQHLRDRIDVSRLEVDKGEPVHHHQYNFHSDGGEISIASVGPRSRAVVGAMGRRSRGAVNRLLDLFRP